MSLKKQVREITLNIGFLVLAILKVYSRNLVKHSFPDEMAFLLFEEPRLV